MWHDIETTEDLLNFKVVADAAAKIVIDSKEQPLSIGVSGTWGTGKSSLVKMIGKSLSESDEGQKFLFLEFNAWLYQGYDDARMALLQSVSDKLTQFAEDNKTDLDKAKEFAKRINWLRLGKIIAPTLSGALLGGTFAGPLGAFIGAASGVCKAGVDVTEVQISELKAAYNNLSPELNGLLKDKVGKSMPQEISELRYVFADLLQSLNLTLVVLVDDLDRCLPDTAISTLEAMRLLLFTPRTAFVIAADEYMIRGAVRAHFSNLDLQDEIVTSYFDKLIQIPIHVPKIGVSEIKAYIILLFAERYAKTNDLNDPWLSNTKKAISQMLLGSWVNGFPKKAIEDALSTESKNLQDVIDFADQLAPIFMTSSQIAGNPRLIKRFLNDLIISESIANAHGMSVAFDQLVKIKLFERCASKSAFEFLSKSILVSDEGCVDVIHEIEEALTDGSEHEMPDKSWEDPFVTEWLKLNPKLGKSDLRPLLHLSRIRRLKIAQYDELSARGREVLGVILQVDRIDQDLINQLQQLGEDESLSILNRIGRKAREHQWAKKYVFQALHVPLAHEKLSKKFIEFLVLIPPHLRPISIIPRLAREDWARDILNKWAEDGQSSNRLKKAIAASI